MVNFGPLMAEIDWRLWGTPANFIGFQRAPPIFGRAAITMGIYLRSSCVLIVKNNDKYSILIVVVRNCWGSIRCR